MEMTPDTIDFNSLSKKQLVELVIAKYNDCFRLEEENKKLKEDNKRLREGVNAGQRLVEDLISKNKNLKEKVERWEKCFKKGGFNPQDVEYLMEEDTLQELKDIGEI